MPLVSKTVEVNANAAAILSIVADFESYPQWNEEVRAVYVLARYNDGRPSQLRVDTAIQGFEGTYIQAVYYPARPRSRPCCSRANCSPNKTNSSRWLRWARPAC